MTEKAVRRAPDLTTYEAEPIHIPGRVQPHGVLFVVDEPALTVAQVSANVFELLFLQRADVLNRTLSDLLSPESAAKFAEIAALPDPRPMAPVRLIVNAREFDAIAHRHAGRLIVELEPILATHPAIDPDRLVRFTLLNLRNGLLLQEFCGAIAREVRTLTRYDRVMVYRFDSDWNGEVFAEEKRADLEPFLGLRYPASDIPAQARRLYHLNLVRHIPNVTYTSAPLVPELDTVTRLPLDLSHATLRSVSPVHVEYLQNMEVAGTLTISLLKDAKLWGLVSCHHYAPLFIPYRVRAACESLAVLVALQLSAKQDAEDLRSRMTAQTRLARLVAILDGPVDSAEALSGQTIDFAGLTCAAGAAIVNGDRVLVVGKTPGAEATARLAAWVEAGRHDEFVTNTLPAICSAADASTASGLLAVRIGKGIYLMWFRPEIVESVTWAGDPHSKRVVMGPHGSRLTPRGSFALWSEEQRGKSEEWTDCDRDAAKGLRDAVRAVQARQATSLLTEARRRDDFLAAVAHELRNPLGPIRNAASLIRMGPGKPEVSLRAADIIDRQAGHLTRLVDDLLDASRAGRGKLRVDLTQVDLCQIVRATAEDAQPALESADLVMQLMIPMEPIWVHGDALRLAQLVSNLLGNAAKFSNRGGTVSVSVRTTGTYAEIAVADGGIGIAPENLPRVFEAFAQIEETVDRSRDGLGLGLSLVKAIAELHGGDVRAESPGIGGGALFTARLPLSGPDHLRN
jgi:two-component system, chemotaxis family, sensor kinase Cph1